MDKTRGFYPFDVGSIPTGGTQVKQKHYSSKNSFFVLETELLQLRACVPSRVIIFAYFLKQKLDELGEEVLMRVSELET